MYFGRLQLEVNQLGLLRWKIIPSAQASCIRVLFLTSWSSFLWLSGSHSQGLIAKGNLVSDVLKMEFLHLKVLSHRKNQLFLLITLIKCLCTLEIVGCVIPSSFFLLRILLSMPHGWSHDCPFQGPYSQPTGHVFIFESEK